MHIKTKIKRILDSGTTFLVVRYNIEFGGHETTEYALITLMHDRRTVDEFDIPTREARDVIAEKGMTEVSNNEHGRVWELPGAPFKKKFKGKYLDFS
jgi:hypothetical protein